MPKVHKREDSSDNAYGMDKEVSKPLIHVRPAGALGESPDLNDEQQAILASPEYRAFRGKVLVEVKAFDPTARVRPEVLIPYYQANDFEGAVEASIAESEFGSDIV